MTTTPNAPTPVDIAARVHSRRAAEEIALREAEANVRNYKAAIAVYDAAILDLAIDDRVKVRAFSEQNRLPLSGHEVIVEDILADDACGCGVRVAVRSTSTRETARIDLGWLQRIES
jgi:hypothetical protein